MGVTGSSSSRCWSTLCIALIRCVRIITFGTIGYFKGVPLDRWQTSERSPERNVCRKKNIFFSEGKQQLIISGLSTLTVRVILWETYSTVHTHILLHRFKTAHFLHFMTHKIQQTNIYENKIKVLKRGLFLGFNAGSFPRRCLHVDFDMKDTFPSTCSLLQTAPHRKCLKTLYTLLRLTPV